MIKNPHTPGLARGKSSHTGTGPYKKNPNYPHTTGIARTKSNTTDIARGTSNTADTARGKNSFSLKRTLLAQITRFSQKSKSWVLSHSSKNSDPFKS